jgi:radical SAM protein with 4Fe4S-binding SPASM domain
LKLITSLRYITLKKIINLLLLELGFLLSRVSGRLILWGKPVSLTVEPTNSCNLLCPECERTKQTNYSPGELEIPVYNKILSESYTYLFSLVLHFQGEPFLHPRILEMISLASKKKIYTIISTNGQDLDDDIAREIVNSGLNEIIVSMDGLDQSTYEKYRVGGDLKRVKTGIQNLVRYKKEHGGSYPEITLQCLVFSHNQHQVNDIKRWGGETGVDRVRIKTARMIEYKKGNLRIPDNKFARYRLTDNGQYELKSRFRNYCWRSWSRSVITCDGEILPCCFDVHKEFVFGNIKEQPFTEIWTSDQYNSFRKKILKNRKAIKICRNCTEGVSYSI